MKQVLRQLLALVIFLAYGAPYAADEEVTAVINPMPVQAAEYLNRIRLPDGFRISIYSDAVQGPRSLAMSASGTLFVGTFLPTWGQPPYGKVYAVLDGDGDQRADEVVTIAGGLNHPNGVALHDGDLYVAELNRILRYRDIEQNLRSPPPAEVVYDGYPGEFHHGWKFIRFGPDNRLYVPVGAPCNTCEPELPHAAITSMNPDGSDFRIFARGIRNSVGFDWHPLTGELWFTDNGRDGWGNDRPPEELNRAPAGGLHFGFPYRYGKTLADDTFKSTLPDNAFTPAAAELPAHRAGLGMRFYTGQSFPAQYRNQVFIAHHGSWNRNPPDGFSVALARIENNEVAGYEDFASGWLIDGRFWGRPVDVEIMADGSLLVSDDFANVIYRISYEPRQ